VSARHADVAARYRVRCGLALLCLVLVTPLLSGCPDRRADDLVVFRVAGGDARQGPEIMRRYGCIDCHTIPGVRGANTFVGPPLTAWAHRVYIAGLVPNTPENLVTWIQHPQRIHPQTAMPAMGLATDEARHVAAYLYTLR
jgi:cytochrome c